MSTLFDPISIEDHHLLLASHTASGKAWKNVFNQNDDFGKLFLGLAIEFQRFQVLEKKLFDEMDIRQTNELLTEWEKSVNIPDTCFANNIEDLYRRIQIEQKFSSYGGVQLNEDFVRVALAFGVTVYVESGEKEGSIADPKIRAHTIFVDILASSLGGFFFPLPFPLQFSLGVVEFIQCLFQKIAPATVQIIVENKIV